MAISDEVRIRILTDVAKAGKDLAAFGLTVGGVTLAFKKVVEFARQAEQAYFGQEQAVAKLNAVLKSTGGTAGYTGGQLAKMATDLQRVTTFGDETTMSAQAVLATFTKVGRDVFPKAIEAAMDMSTVMGQDLQSSIVQIGKALNDPILGVTALRKVGVQLTEQQEAQIKSFVALGDVSSAQALIMKELQTEFGGAARAMGDTAYGASEKLKNAYGDLQEAMGQSVAQGMKPFREWLTRIIEGFTESISQANALREVLSKTFTEQAETPMETLNLALKEIETRFVQLGKLYQSGTGAERIYAMEQLQMLDSQRVFLLEQIKFQEQVAFYASHGVKVSEQQQRIDAARQAIFEQWNKEHARELELVAQIAELEKYQFGNEPGIESKRLELIAQYRAELDAIYKKQTDILDTQESTAEGPLKAMADRWVAIGEAAVEVKGFALEHNAIWDASQKSLEYMADRWVAMGEAAQKVAEHSAAIAETGGVTEAQMRAQYQTVMELAYVTEKQATDWGEVAGYINAATQALEGDMNDAIKSLLSMMGPEGQFLSAILGAFDLIQDKIRELFAAEYFAPDIEEMGKSFADAIAGGIDKGDWESVEEALNAQIRDVLIAAAVQSAYLEKFAEKFALRLTQYLNYQSPENLDRLREAYQDMLEAAEEAGAIVDELTGELGMGGVPETAMASGGIVTRPTRALIGEAGPEAVIPLSGGGVGATYIIQGSLIAERDVDRRVAAAMARKSRGY